MVFDTNLGAGAFDYCLGDVWLNISGNTSGLIWSGFSGDFGGKCNSYTTCGRPCTADINWTTGELLTVTIIEGGQRGYTGSNTTIAPDYDNELDVRLNLYATDIKGPEYGVVAVDPVIVRSRANTTLSAYWRENSGVLWVYVQHNASGAWVNETVWAGENISEAFNVSHPGKKAEYGLNSSLLTRGLVVFWKMTVQDPTGLMNITMPLQNFTVQNALPEVTSIDIIPHTLSESTDASCTSSTYDADQDNISVTYRWWKNTTLLPYTTQNLTSGNYTANDTITCEVTAYDGFEYGTPLNDSANVTEGGQIDVSIIFSQGWNLFSLPVNVT